MSKTKEEYQDEVNQKKEQVKQIENRIQQLHNQKQQMIGQINYICQQAKEEGYQVDQQGNISEVPSGN